MHARVSDVILLEMAEITSKILKAEKKRQQQQESAVFGKPTVAAMSRRGDEDPNRLICCDGTEGKEGKVKLHQAASKASHDVSMT